MFSTKPGASLAVTAGGGKTAKVGQTVTVALTIANHDPMSDAGVSLASVTAGGPSWPVPVRTYRCVSPFPCPRNERLSPGRPLLMDC